MSLLSQPPTDLGAVLSEFKQIPAYQRNFVWSAEQAAQFVEDLFDAHTRDAELYFIGSMVFANTGNESPIQIVDGQQRISTILIILGCLFQRYLDAGGKEKQAEKRREKTFYDYDDNSHENRPLFKTNDPNTQTVLDSIGVAGARDMDIHASNQTVRLMWLACQAIDEKLDELQSEYSLDDTKLDLFGKFILNNVQLIYYTARSLDEATTIYERLNTGGKPLSSLEVLKGKTFAQCEEDENEWALVDAAWQDLSNRLAVNKKLKAEIISRVWISSQYKEAVLRESDTGLIANKNITRFILNSIELNEPRQVVISLDNSIQRLEKYFKGFTADGSNNLACGSITAVAPSATSHLHLFEMSFGLPKTFDIAAKISRAVVISIKLLTKYTGGTEALFAKWAQFVHEQTTNGVVDDKIASQLSDMALEELSENWWPQLEAKLDTMRYDREKAKVRLVLKIIELVVDKEANGFVWHEGFSAAKFKNSNADIEHLRPQSELFDDDTHRLGNLCLWEPKYNRANKNKSYGDSIKQRDLKSSEFKSTKAICFDYDSGSGAEKSAFNLLPYIADTDAFGTSTISKRQTEMIDLVNKFLFDFS